MHRDSNAAVLSRHCDGLTAESVSSFLCGPHTANANEISSAVMMKHSNRICREN